MSFGGHILTFVFQTEGGNVEQKRGSTDACLEPRGVSILIIKIIIVEQAILAGYD